MVVRSNDQRMRPHAPFAAVDSRGVAFRQLDSTARAGASFLLVEDDADLHTHVASIL